VKFVHVTELPGFKRLRTARNPRPWPAVSLQFTVLEQLLCLFIMTNVWMYTVYTLTNFVILFIAMATRMNRILSIAMDPV
jgi:hypothetical protein